MQQRPGPACRPPLRIENKMLGSRHRSPGRWPVARRGRSAYRPAQEWDRSSASSHGPAAIYRSASWRCDSAAQAAARAEAVVPRPRRARLDVGDSSSQVDPPRGGPGRLSCVGTRLAPAIGAPLFVSRGEGALRYVRRFGSAASGCRNRTNLAVGLRRRTALPSMTSASGRRRSSRSISP